MSPTLKQKLPRESRDTLFLLATIAAVVAPHAAHLPLWCSALTALMLAWRALLAWREAALPGRWTLVLALLITGALTWLTHRTLLGREAGITMLVVLMALKTLELRARRDALVVFFLGFFLVLTQFFYSQSLLMALWTLACVWALLSALVLAQMPLGQPSLARAALTAARTTAWGLPVMVALFVLFPRLGPLWGLPSDAVGRTGLSNQLSFGAMAEIANDESIAMRLRFQGAAPPAAALYFRGPVLVNFDGRVWRPRAEAGGFGRQTPASESLQVRGPALRYEMTLEPQRLSVLPLLEASPPTPDDRLQVDELLLRRSPDLQWVSPRPITERLRLQVAAYLQFQAGPLQPTLALQEYLALPPRLNPRTLAWASDLRQSLDVQALPAEQRAPVLVAAVLQHLRDGGYLYSLAPGRYGEASPHLIDEFWLDRRIGFCEHFAAGFVVVMRAMGVPARIVTGYQGADPQLQDGDLIVRNSQAHAWVEVWSLGQGWLRVDPTAAVAPERISRGQVLLREPGALAQALGGVGRTLWPLLREQWETLNHRWQELVLNYSRQQQFDLLKSLGWTTPDWRALGQLSAMLIALAVGLASAWMLWHARPREAWTWLRDRLLRDLHAMGLLDAAAHQSPGQWAALLQARHGARSEPLQALLLSLEAARYGRPEIRAQLTLIQPGLAGWLQGRRFLSHWRRARRAYAGRLNE
jgi:transglutaminase-like putative cysteine protease